VQTLSLSALTVIDAAPADVVAAAAAGGFDAVGLRVVQLSSPPPTVPIAGDNILIADLRHRADDHGLRIFDIEAVIVTSEPDIELQRQILDAGARLGAQNVLAIVPDEDPARRTDNLGRLADLAAGFGLRVGLEFMPFRAIRSLPDALKVVNGLKHPNLAIVVDALHLSRSGGSPRDLAGLPPELLAYVQLCDAPATAPAFDELPQESRADRLLPGAGELWLPGLLAALPEDCPITVETPVRMLEQVPPVERGRIVGSKTRAYLVQHGIASTA
jgi:sugar phosphate isomerase/epimerase